jgi:hypothetical protein
MKAKFINEKFTEDSDPIKDLSIGIKDYYVICFDYSDIKAAIKQIKKALKKLHIEAKINFKELKESYTIEAFVEECKNAGIHMYEHPDADGTDMYAFIITKFYLSDTELEEIIDETSGS